MADVTGTIFHIGGTVNFRAEIDPTYLDTAMTGEKEGIISIIGFDDQRVPVNILYRRDAVYGIVYKETPLVARAQKSLVTQ